jgi:hypothetical protein
VERRTEHGTSPREASGEPEGTEGTTSPTES